ncbi:MAG: hypothetical protein R3325_08550 [Thermoanaerobaculia bacterium]|nr:hypothetical protein [Thermoanaerobaculia bacterium]
MKQLSRIWILIAAMAAVALVGAPDAAADNRGFIYGTVETESGNTYRGILRWGTEESFWDDHFNSSKKDLPYRKRGRGDGGRRSRIKVFGVTVGYRWDDSWGGRQFISRFGDITSVEIRGGDDLELVMKGGERIALEGGSNDVGARITVLDESLGEVKVEWKRIERIVFSATPPDVKAPARRLYGVLTTEDDEKFEGYIQWDIQECLWTDELDGETEDGDLSIEMGKIRAIEKRNRHGAWVELKDGRRLLLEDTNDVDHTTDGIFVEDRRYGRVEVPWDAFARLDFQEVAHTGPGYDEYKPGRGLRGTVTDDEGRKYGGEIVFDLDESRDWELLNGERFDIEYHIPFSMVRSIERLGRDSSLVRLRNGEIVELEDGTDVSDDNAGVLVMGPESEDFVAWEDLKLLELE